MPTETRVRAWMRSPTDPGTEVEETWTVLSHDAGGEWWSEVLDGARHPYVQRDQFGFETVQKFYGDTFEESRQAAMAALHDVVQERGGRVENPGGSEEP